MTYVAATALVSGLHHARATGQAIEGALDVGMTPNEGLTMQLDILRRFTDAGETLGGWKVGLTSGVARDAMGQGFRPFGFLLQSRILSSGAKLPPNTLGYSVEPELCVVIGEPLRGDDLDPAVVKRAVRAVAPAFEINETRTPPGAGAGLVIADGLGNWGIAVGAETQVRDDLANTPVELYAGAEPVASIPSGMAMDDPFLSVARLCATLHRYGLGLEPGQKIITGAFCRHQVASPGPLRAVFSGLGEVLVNA
jgi:2-keto-4-pentenoate hydratase